MGIDDITKLRRIKIIHTIVWIFFNLVMIYLFYAVIRGKIDVWVWAGLGLFVLEGIILLLFGMICPLTVMARRYSDSTHDNFDIFLPNWLAKYTKVIYTSLLAVIIVILTWRLMVNEI